jgi:hypothetical protein
MGSEIGRPPTHQQMDPLHKEHHGFYVNHCTNETLRSMALQHVLEGADQMEIIW